MPRQTITTTRADGTRSTYTLQPGSTVPIQLDALKPLKPARIKADRRVYPKYKPGMSTAEYVALYQATNNSGMSCADFWQPLNTAPAAGYAGIDTVEHDITDELADVAPAAPMVDPVAAPAPVAEAAPAATVLAPAAPSAVPDALPWQILAARPTATYATPARTIGVHEWVCVVYAHETYGACTDYVWRRVDQNRRAFRQGREWPTYDSNRGNYGQPATLAKLYAEHETEIRAALAAGRPSPLHAWQSAAARANVTPVQTAAEADSLTDACVDRFGTSDPAACVHLAAFADWHRAALAEIRGWSGPAAPAQHAPEPAPAAEPAPACAPAAVPRLTPAAPSAAAPSMPRRMPEAPAILADAVASSARPAPGPVPDDGEAQSAARLGAHHWRDGCAELADWMMRRQLHWTDAQVHAYQAGYRAAAGDPPSPAGPGPGLTGPTADAPARGVRPLASALEHSIPAPGGTPYGGIPDPAPAGPAGQAGPDAAELVARSRPGLWLAEWLAIRRALSAGPAIRPRGAAPARDAPRRGARPASSAPGARWRGPGGIPYGGICSDGVVLSPRIVSPPGDHPQAPGFSPTAAPAVEFSARRRPESSRAKREQPAGARAALAGAGCWAKRRPIWPSTVGAAFPLAIGRPWPDGWLRTVAGRSAAGLARFGHAWPSGAPPSIATSRALQGDEWCPRRDTYRSSALVQPLPGARAGLAGIGRPAGGLAWAHRSGASGATPGAFPAVRCTPPPTLYSDIGAPPWRAPGAFSALAGLPAARPPTPYGDIRHPLIPAKDRP